MLTLKRNLPNLLSNLFFLWALVHFGMGGWRQGYALLRLSFLALPLLGVALSWGSLVQVDWRGRLDAHLLASIRDAAPVDRALMGPGLGCDGLLGSRAAHGPGTRLWRNHCPGAA